MSEGPRVLFVSGTPPGSATCRYRCEHFAHALRAEGAQAEVVYVGQPRVRVAHDVVVLYRVCATAEGRRFAQAARACGAALVYSTDDLVFDAQDAPPELGHRFRALAPLHLSMLRGADAALASTEYLAGRMRAAAPETPVVTLRNFLSENLVQRSHAARRVMATAALSERNTERTTLGYFAGTPTHDADFAVIAEPLRELLLTRPLVDLLIVGPLRLPAVLREYEANGRIRRLPAVPWEILPQLVLKQGVGINLAPLDLTSPFCHAKSEVKFLEAALLGIPTIASSAAGFAEAIPDRAGARGCFLAEDSRDWQRWLALLSGKKQTAAEAGQEAFRYVHAVGTEAANAEKSGDFFRSLTCRRTPDAASFWREQVVNWPFSFRYALKGALERGTRLRAAVLAKSLSAKLGNRT